MIDNLLRMLGLRRTALPADEKNPELEKAVKRVETLHHEAEHVLDEYSAAEKQRLANGRHHR